MTTLLRKLLVLAVVGVVLVLASIYEVVRWLTHLGVPEMAGRVSERYLIHRSYCISLLSRCCCLPRSLFFGLFLKCLPFP